MRIAVLGAGAMGSWFGGELALAGNDVQLLTTNEAHRAAVTANGLLLRGSESERTVRLPIHSPADIDAPVDLVLLFTKTFQSEAALHSVAHAFGKQTIVLGLQNGLGNAETIARHVPLERVLVGMSMMPVDRVAPGVVASKGEGITLFGPAAHRHADSRIRIAQPFVQQVVEAFLRTSLEVRFDADVVSRIWEKVAFNAGMNACSALSGGTPGDVGRLPEARQLTQDVAREVAAVGASRDITIDLDAVFATIDYACTHHGGHKASMLQDLEAGKRTEVDALNGAVVALGDAASVPVPLNRVLATLVRLAEAAHAR